MKKQFNSLEKVALAKLYAFGSLKSIQKHEN